MVIANLHVISGAVFPSETYPPPLIDAKAVLPFSITPQPFKPVAGRECEVIYVLNRMNQK